MTITARYKDVLTVPSVIDNDWVQIKIPAVFLYNENEWAIDVDILNKRPDKEAVVVLESISVNGVQSSPCPSFDERAAGGKLWLTQIVLEDENLDKRLIGEYSEIEIRFSIYPPKDSPVEVLFEQINVYPFGLGKAKKYARNPRPNDAVILDNEYCTITVTGYGYDSDGYAAHIFIENKYDKTLMFCAGSAKINGNEEAVLLSEEVVEGKYCFSEILCPGKESPGKVEKIEFDLEIIEEPGFYYRKRTIEKKSITLNP